MNNPSPASEPQRIRALVMELQQGAILLPHSAVQEIIIYRDPEPVSDAPDWMLGTLQWRRWTLPLASAERLIGWGFDENEMRKVHIAVCNLLTGDDRYPCVGLMTRGIPHVVQVDSAQLVPAPVIDSPWVAENVYFANREIWVPDLQALGREVVRVLT